MRWLGRRGFLFARSGLHGGDYGGLGFVLGLLFGVVIYLFETLLKQSSFSFGFAFVRYFLIDSNKFLHFVVEGVNY